MTDIRGNLFLTSNLRGFICLKDLSNVIVLHLKVIANSVKEND